MPVTYCQGDVFLTECQTIAHGCNCIGVMGAGIAKEVKKRYPDCYQEYWVRCHSNHFIPGDYYLWKSSDKWILNMATQYGINGADIDLVKTSFNTISKYYKEEGIESIAMPLIGCGLGGLTWDSVKAIIQENMGSIAIPVFVYEKYVPNLKFEETLNS